MNTLIELKLDMIEQVMRVAREDVDVIPFLDAEPGSRAALSALGRLLSNAPLRLVPGCPLVAWAQGGGFDVNWRMSYPPLDGSLWLNLTFLSTIYGPSSSLNPYEQLEELRSRETSDSNF